MEGITPGSARQMTATGRSAIAVIRLTGDLPPLDSPPAVFRAANRRRVADQSIDAVCFGVWGDPGEEVVVCRTGSRSIEVTCHGGTAAVARILEDAEGRGFGVEAQSVVFRSAKDRPFAEQKATDRALEPLIRARTQRTAEILLEQSSLWPPFIASVRHGLREEARRLTDEALAWAEFGRHLTEPWSVVLCGRPNVGKSSLMNALAGFTRSIVSEQAGTTRDRVTLETAIDGWPVRITDTAGVRESSDSIERAGVEQTLSALGQADLAVIVLDSSVSLPGDELAWLNVPVRQRIVVAHKSDLPRSTGSGLPEGHLAVSSVTGHGLEALLRAISARLIPALPPVGQAFPVTSQQADELQTDLPP